MTPDYIVLIINAACGIGTLIFSALIIRESRKLDRWLDEVDAANSAWSDRQ